MDCTSDSVPIEVSTPSVAEAPLRVLVIDDNAPDVMLISESLREEGLTFEITHLRDGEEAVGKLTESASCFTYYDLIILDLSMPRVGGLEVLSTLRRTSELKVPILVFTSSLAPDDQEEVRRLGADRYLNKPADLYEFLGAVGSIVKELVPRARLKVRDGSEE